MTKQNKSGNWRTLKKWKSSSCFREDLMAESASSTRSFFISATTLHRSASSSSGAIARTAMETRYRWENKGTLREGSVWEEKWNWRTLICEFDDIVECRSPDVPVERREQIFEGRRRGGLRRRRRRLGLRSH